MGSKITVLFYFIYSMLRLEKKFYKKTFARWKWEEIQWEGKFNNFIKLDFKFPVISAELCRSILKNSWISKNVRHFVCLEHGIINVRVKVHILYSNISTKESLYVYQYFFHVANTKVSPNFASRRNWSETFWSEIAKLTP